MKPLVVAATIIKFRSAFLHEFNIYCLQGSKFVHSWHKGCLREVFDNMFQYASNIHCHNTRYTAKKNLYKMSVRTNVARQTINLFYSYRHLEGPSNSFKKGNYTLSTLRTTNEIGYLRGITVLVGHAT